MSIQSNFPAIKPTLLLDFANTEELDPRITFTRASTATYYGTQTAKAEQNLLIRSQEFNEAVWAKAGNATVTANDQTAPDGTQTADTINLPENVARLTQNLTVAAGEYTASVFLKGTAGETTRIELGGTGNATQVTFTGDWQRVSVTATLSAGATTFIIVRRIVSGDTASTFGAWGAQLEQRSAVTAYTPTTTQPITTYVPVLLSAADNVARFDHNPVTGESLGLLIEEQRTNLLTYSAQFDDAAWAKVRSSITSNTIVAPDGTLAGDKLIEDTTNGSHDTAQTYSVVSGTTYTFVIFVKAAERTACVVKLNRTSDGNLFSGVPFVYVDLTTGDVLDSGNVISYSVNDNGNGWYRISVSQTASGTGSQTASVSVLLDNDTASYTGNGFDGIYIWGAQLEVGAFPTSYIPTVASQVTRAADAASMTGANFSSWYRADEGTVCVFGTSFNSTSAEVIHITDAGVSTNFIELRAGVGGADPRIRVDTNGTNQAERNVALAANTTANLAVVYKVNDVQIAVNEQLSTQDNSVFLPAVNRMFIGSRSDGSRNVNTTIKKVSFYPKRLDNAELQALTQI